MTDEHKIEEYGEQLPDHVKDLGDEPIIASAHAIDDEGDANTDTPVTKADAPSDDDAANGPTEDDDEDELEGTPG